MRPSVVYFIQCGNGGPVKIGISTDVAERLASLQTANPYQLHLIGTVPGGADLEDILHGRFAAGRLQGEWFDVATSGLTELLRHVFHHGELPPVAIGDPAARGCSTCPWALEPELAERGETRCWRCQTEAVLASVPATSQIEGR